MALIRQHMDFSSPVCYYCEVGKVSRVKDICEEEKKNKKEGKKKSAKSSRAQSYTGEKAGLPRNGTSKQFRRKVSVCIPSVVPLCHYHPWSMFLTSAVNYYSKCFCLGLLFFFFIFRNEKERWCQAGGRADRQSPLATEQSSL